MLTNEMIKRIHDNAVAHGFHDPDSEPTFGEYCALIHEEISEAFSAWRKGEPDEYVKDGKPEGVWVELADVVIRCADVMAAWKYNFRILDVQFDLRRDLFGEFTSILHFCVSEAYWQNNVGDTKGIQLCLMVSIVYAFADRNGIDLDAIIERKHAYNVTRPPP